MTAKDELAALVADLDDDTAAEVLAYARWLLAEGQGQPRMLTCDDLPPWWRRADERPRD